MCVCSRGYGSPNKFLVSKETKVYGGWKGGECFHHAKKAAWSPPKDYEREGAEQLFSYLEFLIFTRWHCMGTCQCLYSRSLSSPNFSPPRFSCSNCIWTAPDRGKSFSNCLIWKGRRNQPLPLSFSSLLPPLVLSLSLSVLLSIPSPRDRAHLPDLGCRRPHSDQLSACRAAHRLQPSLDLWIFVCNSTSSCTYR